MKTKIKLSREPETEKPEPQVGNFYTKNGSLYRLIKMRGNFVLFCVHYAGMRGDGVSSYCDFQPTALEAFGGNFEEFELVEDLEIKIVK